jgi:hypothetical protein
MDVGKWDDICEGIDPGSVLGTQLETQEGALVCVAG